MKSDIKNKIKDIPLSPGVYHFLDENGLVLYVGKAKNLRNRIKQYYMKELGRGPGIENMVRLAADIRFVETESEIEAVLLEADIIKKLKPKYNIRLKDDKSFYLIKITKEDFPSVELVRFRNVDRKDKSAFFFGPYPAGEALKTSLKFLRKIFPYRDCSKTKFSMAKKKKRTCIYGDIRVCSGPCAEWVNKTQYNKSILMLKSFLKGRKGEIVKKLEREMNQLSKTHRFEEAALVRNKLAALGHLKDVAVGIRDDVFNPENILFKRIECYDISNISGKYPVGSMVVFTNGKPDTDEYRKFKIPENLVGESGDSDLSRIKNVLERRFGNDWQKPDLLVIDGGEMHLRVAKEVIKNIHLDIPIISISKGPARKKNDFHFSNRDIAQYFMNDQVLTNVTIASRDEAHRFAIGFYRKLHLKDMFAE